MQALLKDIRAAYPPFAKALDTFNDSGSAYFTMQRFARFLIDSYEAGERDTLQPAFDIVEQALVAGTAEVREAATLWFLEALQNIASHRACGPEVFEKYLGTTSRRAWDDLNAIWKGKESLAEVIAAERGVSLRRPWWQFWRRRKSPGELLANVANPELRALIEGMTREGSKK